MAKRKSNVPVIEWIWYLFAAILAAWGIAQIICGLILEFAQTTINDWPLYIANQEYTKLFGLSFLHWGLILLGIGALLAVLVLCITAGKYDRESEKASRRAARLAHNNEETMVVDAEVKEPTENAEPTKAE